MGGWPGARRGLRSVAVVVNSGLIAGILVAGLGGRLFMRVMAATSDDSVQGVLTDADQRVGEISFGGTFSLIIFGGVLGGLAATFLYRLLRPWLPRRAWAAGAIVGVIALGLLGRVSDLLNRDNKDFEILSPTPLAAGIIVVAAVFFGVVLGSVSERLDRGMPEIRWSFGLLAYAPLAMMFTSPPTVAIVLLSPFVAAFTPGSFRWNTSAVAARVGRVIVAAALAAAVIVITVDVAAIAV